MKVSEKSFRVSGFYAQRSRGCRIGDIKVEKIFLETKPKLFEMSKSIPMRHCGNRVLAPEPRSICIFQVYYATNESYDVRNDSIALNSHTILAVYCLFL